MEQVVKQDGTGSMGGSVAEVEEILSRISSAVQLLLLFVQLLLLLLRLVQLLLHFV